MNTDIDISKIRKLDGGLLLVFQQLLEHGSVTRTALSLDLSQSTISHALSRLRELFGDPLFIRRPHGLEPTQRALQLKPQVEMLLNLTRDTLGIGQSFEPDNSARIFSISAPEFVTATVATSLLAQIEREAPDIGLRFVHLPADEVFEKLRRGEIDAAIGRFEQAPIEVALEPLYDDEFAIACRTGHPISKGNMTAKKYRSALHIWADSPSEIIERDSEIDFSDFHVCIVPRWLTALLIAARSDYVATCPRRLAESHAQLLGLDVLGFPQQKSISVSIASRKNLQDRGVEWFIQQIRNVFV